MSARRTPIRALLVTAAVVIVLAIGAIVYAMATRSEAPAPDPDAVLPGTRSTTHVLDEVGPDVPTLVEYLDFECEACGGLYPVIEMVREEYAGRINYAFRYFPLPGHHNSMNAALAVEAAAQQGRVEDMFHLMFQRQAEWGEQQVSAAGTFRGYAEELGLDLDAYDEAVADPVTRERIEVDFDEGRSLGVQGTPAFFLDGERLEPESLTDLIGSLDRAIAEHGE